MTARSLQESARRGVTSRDRPAGIASGFAFVLLSTLHAIAMAQATLPSPPPAGLSQHRTDLYEKNSLSVNIVFPATNAVIDQGTTAIVPLNVSISSGSPLDQITVTVCEAQTATTCVPNHSSPAVIAIPAEGPYQAFWTPPSYGTSVTKAVGFIVWASVSNTAGETATSRPTPFSYVYPPSRGAMLVAPGHDVGFYAPASPAFWATLVSKPEDPSTIDHVDFLDGSTVIGSLRTTNSTPEGFAFLWNNAPIGEHAVSFRSIDSTGRVVATSPIAVYVVPAPGPIEVTLGAPRTGDTYAVDAPIPLRASATVNAGEIERVEFTDGASVVATVYAPPYESTWLAPSIGRHAISARAFDDLGNASSSAAAYVQSLAWPQKPTILMLSPNQGATFARNTTVALTSATEAGDAPITHVDYWVDGAIVTSTTSPPYAGALSSAPVGAHRVAAAVYDSSGRSTTSGTIAFNVTPDGLPPDGNPSSTLPIIALVSPANNANFVEGDTVHLVANASQTGGSISRVDFKADGLTVTTATSTPWAGNWTGMGAGTYSLTAVATSNANTTATSAAVNIRVAAAPTAITLAAPPAGATYYPGDAITLLPANMHVSGAITHVEYYVDGTLIGNSTSTPYGYEWDVDKPGSFSVTARVYDSAGNMAQSMPVVMTIRQIAVRITSPADTATVDAATVAVEGTYEGPGNIGVVVNGVIAINDGRGRFFVNDLSLPDPQTSITATATSMGGSRVSQAITVATSATSNTVVPRIMASQDEGIDSLTAHISVSDADVASWRVLDLGGGTTSPGTPETGDVATLNFAAPGLYTPTMEITDKQGRVTHKRLVILVSNSADVVHAQISIVNQLFDALLKQNKSRALATMTSELAGQFSSIYDALQDHWPTIIGSLSQPGATMYGTDTFEAALTRTRDGEKYLYLIEGMRDSDGVWRIDSL